MKTVMWDEFSKLPDGTIFQEFIPGRGLGRLSLLTGVLEIPGFTDFFSAEILPQIDYPDNLVKTPIGIFRDATYDFVDRHWLVWEESDRVRLANWLLDPVSAIKQMNDDPQMIIPFQEWYDTY